MITGTNTKGFRRYSLLVPIEIEGGARVEAIDMRPVTLGMARKWDMGEYDGPTGMVDAFTAAICVQPWSVLEMMQHPDADRFYEELMLHLPSRIREAISQGAYPMPAPPASRPTQDAATGQPARSALPGEEAIHAAPPGFEPEAGHIEPDFPRDPEPDPTPEQGYGFDGVVP